MKCFVRKTLSGWEPADEQAREMHAKHPRDIPLRADIVQPRNYKHHCLFMALMTLTFDNQVRYTNPRMFRRAVALEAGHVEQVIGLDGEVHLIPLSYSYDDLPDEQEAEQRFGEALAVCADILKMSAPELRHEVEKYAIRYRVAA